MTDKELLSAMSELMDRKLNVFGGGFDKKFSALEKNFDKK